jgi:hypothetical protein
MELGCGRGGEEGWPEILGSWYQARVQETLDFLDMTASFRDA